MREGRGHEREPRLGRPLRAGAVYEGEGGAGDPLRVVRDVLAQPRAELRHVGVVDGLGRVEPAPLDELLAPLVQGRRGELRVLHERLGRHVELAEEAGRVPRKRGGVS